MNASPDNATPLSAPMTDQRMELVVSTILRSGVLISGVVVLAGAVLYLTRHWNELVAYHRFHGQPEEDRLIGSIIKGVAQGRAKSVMQLGILLLIGTPVARVAFSLVGFALERDRVYIAITSIVLAILLYSLIAGAYGQV